MITANTKCPQVGKLETFDILCFAKDLLAISNIDLFLNLKIPNQIKIFIMIYDSTS